MSKQTDNHEFKIGHVYSIEYDDHWASTDVYRDYMTEDETYRLRARGVCIRNNPKTVVLENQLHVTDQHPTNKRSGHHGIQKACIVKVQHFGPEKM